MPNKPKRARPTPPALAKVAERRHAAALARVRAQGEADVALVERRRALIADAFYEIGEALQRLARDGVAAALGHESFADSR